VKTILILGVRLNQLSLIKAAKALNLRTIGIDPNPIPRAEQFLDSCFRYDLQDFEACLKVAKKVSPDGVLTAAADYPLPAVAYVSDYLSLAGPSRASVELTVNKTKQYKILSEAGFLTPKTYHFKNLEAVLSFLHKSDNRLIIKPNKGQGGRGVTELNKNSSRRDLCSALESARNSGLDSDILIQEYVNGREFSVESITQNGNTDLVAITEKSTSGYPHHVELGHSQPANVSDVERSIITNFVKNVIRLLRIDDSASHIEIKLNDGKPTIIEAAARMGGGFIGSHLIKLSTGVDYTTAVLRTCLGESISIVPKKQGGAVIKFFTPPKGVISKISGVDAAMASPGVVDLEVYVKAGGETRSLKSNGDRAGHIITVGSNSRDAECLASQASDLVNFTVISESCDE
jgi:biotin carboxylase